MNKFTKASIATGTGIVLLLGGAGTLAYWNAEATTDAGSITAGTLTIASENDGEWEDISSDSVAPGVIDAGTFLVVPGDTLTYTETFEVGATGDNLVAEVEADASSIDKGAWGAALTATTALSIGGTPVTEITSANDGDIVTVVVTLTFDFAGLGVDAPVDNDTQTAVVDLTDLAIVLTQVRP